MKGGGRKWEIEGEQKERKEKNIKKKGRGREMGNESKGERKD